MTNITTKMGKRFDTDWCGVSAVNTLYICTVGHAIDELYQVFKEPAETAELSYTDDGRVTVYKDYTDLIGIQKNPQTGMIQVCLAPREE